MPVSSRRSVLQKVLLQRDALCASYLACALTVFTFLVSALKKCLLYMLHASAATYRNYHARNNKRVAKNANF